MGIEIPKRIFGRDVEGAIEKELANRESPSEPTEPVTNAPDLEGYVFVPPIGVYVAKERTHQDKSWYEAHKALHFQGERMLTLPEFITFTNYLEQNKEAIADAEGILDDIFTVRAPWRSEWLDAKFEITGTEAYVLYDHKVQGDDVVANKREKLEGYLESDKAPGIDKTTWLANPTKHGLPRTDIGNGELYYWKPTNGGVAWFDAGSDGAGLYCGRNPTGHIGSLGVRAVRRASAQILGGTN